MNVDVLPSNDQSNGWSAILPRREPCAPLDRYVHADWLVIGAGYAGLAAARQLATNRPQDTIVILEAGIVGDNASGRNSGFAIDVPHNVGTSMSEVERAAPLQRLLAEGMDELERLVTTHRIDCQWSRAGKYHCAVSERIAREVVPVYAKALDALGEPFEVLDRNQLERRLGTRYFHSGVFTPGGALLNPAALTRGLADSLPRNVTLYENTPVIAMDRSLSLAAVTPHGRVTARQLVIATNTLGPQFGAFRRRMFAVATYGSLSEPLSVAQRARIGNVGEWGVTPANGIVGTTMRYTPDHRILVRQHFTFRPRVDSSAADRESVRRHHRKVFDARFPALSDVRLEHQWAGYFAITANGAPGWGLIEPGIYAAVGCNGVGIVKQTVAGKLLADLATDTPNPLIEDMRRLGTPSLLPPRPLLDVGVNLKLWREKWVARSEY